jgi:hypothetical protein
LASATVVNGGSSPTNRTSTMASPSSPLSFSGALIPSDSTCTLILTATNEGSNSSNTTAQAGRPAPIVRRHDSTSVSQTPASSLPIRPEDLADIASDHPPGYTPDFNNPDPTVRALSQEALTTQLEQLQTILATRNKGSVSVRPYTAPGSIDAVKLVYVGMTTLELTSRELGTPTYLHPSFSLLESFCICYSTDWRAGAVAVDVLSFPGNTFLDMDCESSAYYEGKLPGTVTVSGYSEEYREQQLLRFPLLNLSLEGTHTLPVMPLDKIVSRIRLLQRDHTLEDNDALREILGLSQYVS